MVASCGSDGDALPRPEANIVFATSTVHPGSFGGVVGADAICAERAAEAGLDGTFVAWLSSSDGADAYSRVSGARGWVLRDGTPVADMPDALVTLSLLGPIARDERGRDIRSTQPLAWTGTTSTGQTGGPGTDCSMWTSSAEPTRGMYGDAASVGRQFTDYQTAGCSTPRRLYCFETDRNVPVAVEPHPGRYAFLTASAVIPTAAGMAAADQQCQTEATSAGLPGTYKALLGDGTAAVSRFDLNGEPWVRTDGASLANTALELFTASYLLAPLILTADRTPAAGAAFWGGDPLIAKMNGTCMAFTSRDPAMIVETGRPYTTLRTGMFIGGGIGCDATTLRVLCLQE